MNDNATTEKTMRNQIIASPPANAVVAGQPAGDMVRYRKPILHSQLAIGLLAWALPCTLLMIWWLGSQQGWISLQTLPHPAQVLTTLGDLMASGELAEHVLISLKRVFWGFLIGACAGLLLGIGMGLSTTLKDFLYPTFKVFAYIPLLGWVPLLMIFLGIGETLKYVLIAKATIVPVTLNTYAGVRGVSSQYLEVARVFKLGRIQLLGKVVLPAAFPQIWSGIRFGLTKAWLLLVVVEILASSEGLGYMTISGQQLFQLELVLVAVIIIGIIGFMIDKMLDMVEQRLLKWRSPAF